ncbi:MAG: hypothetical protein QF441_11505 [Bacteriovoracaceae bacterium]|jgi:hypothetical protein|nr:hypothetical protein [Bacteriovoracaceae bacterium]
MKRVIFYGLLVVLIIVSVNWKIGIIQEKRNAPTISISNEHSKHGVPVEVYTVERRNINFYKRITGVVKGDYLESYVSKLLWKKIKRGQKAKVVDDDDIVVGSVSYTATEPDTETGLYKIQLSLEKSQAKINQKFVVDINTKTLKEVLCVPNMAIVTEEKNSFVWLLLPQGQVKKVQVQIGQKSKTYAEIEKGLTLADKIVMSGMSKLNSNKKVKVVNKLGEIK